MREILFRGKPLGKLHDNFIYGSLGVICEDLCAVYHCHEFIDDDIQLVDIGTVGQYTGLTDENGKKIFEGDIVHLYAGEHSISRYKGIDYNALVIFKDGGFCAIDGTEDDYALRRYNFVSRNLYCEVIGNIHDNPELLKEE